MAQVFPGTLNAFSNPAGTNTLPGTESGGLAHATQHSDANDAIEAHEAVLGTTAGTSVLQNFAAGQFPVRNTGGGATGTLVQTIVGGTLNKNTLGSVGATGGTFTTPTVNNATVGTPAVTGGTINNAIVGTPNIVGGTLTLDNNQPLLHSGTSGTARASVNIGTDNFLRLNQVPYQSNTTNSARENVLVEHGWGFIIGNGGVASETVTFQNTFASTPIIIAQTIGAIGTATVPDDPNDFTSRVDNKTSVNTTTTTNFVIAFASATSAAFYYGYSWIAIGVKS